MIALARDIAMFRPTLEAFVRGNPRRYCWSNSLKRIGMKTYAA
jgi:hypothetical protein